MSTTQTTKALVGCKRRANTILYHALRYRVATIECSLRQTVASLNRHKQWEAWKGQWVAYILNDHIRKFLAKSLDSTNLCKCTSHITKTHADTWHVLEASTSRWCLFRRLCSNIWQAVHDSKMYEKTHMSLLVTHVLCRSGYFYPDIPGQTWGRKFYRHGFSEKRPEIWRWTRGKHFRV